MNNIDRSTLQPASNLGKMDRQLAGQVAHDKQARGLRKRGSNMLSGTELELCRFIGGLGKVIAGGLLEPVAVERQPKRREESDEF